MTNTEDLIAAAAKIANGDLKAKLDLNTKVAIETDSIIKICLGLFIVFVLAIIIFIIAFRSTQPQII